MKKRNILLLLAMAGTMAAMAGEINHSIGIQLGWDREIYRLNAPTVSGQKVTDLNKTPLSGGRLGLVYELADESGAGLFTSFTYAYTWYRSKYEKIDYYYDGKTVKPVKGYSGNLEYQTYLQSHRLDLALQPQYKFEIAGGTYLIFYTGPTFQFIAKLEAQDNFRYNDEKDPNVRYYFEDKLNYNSEVMAQYYKRWNLTWGLGAAFQYDIFYLRGGYDFGLVNPYSVTTFGDIKVDIGDGNKYSIFTIKSDDAKSEVQPDNRNTKGRLDCWNVTFGVYFWQKDK